MNSTCRTGRTDKIVIQKQVSTVNCMWRSRLRTTFLSNRDEVNEGDEPTITRKTSYEIYKIVGVSLFLLNHYISVTEF